MKQTLLLLTALSLLPLHAAVKTHWVKGVSESGGWYDSDKAGPHESNLCWAACAANMTAWWQDRNADTAGKTQAPTGKDVWETMRKSLRNNPDCAQSGTNWWFSGQLQPRANASNASAGNYYQELMSGNSFQAKLLRAPNYGTELSFSELMVELIDSGHVISLGIQPVEERRLMGGTHWITLWGVDYDESKKVVTRVYLTDSDDYQPNVAQYQKGLFTADCTWAEDVVAPGNRIFSSLIFRNEIGWFKDNTAITSVVALPQDADFITEQDRKAHEQKEAEEPKNAKSAKKGKKTKADKTAKTEKEDKKKKKEKKEKKKK